MPDPGQPFPDPLLKPGKTAEILDISTRTLSRLVKNGDIAVVRVGGSLRFTLDDLAAFIERNRNNARS